MTARVLQVQSMLKKLVPVGREFVLGALPGSSDFHGVYPPTENDFSVLQDAIYAKPVVLTSKLIDVAQQMMVPELLERSRKDQSNVKHTFVCSDETINKKSIARMRAVAHLYRLPHKVIFVERDTPWKTRNALDHTLFSFKGVLLKEITDTDGNVGIGGCIAGYDTGGAINAPTFFYEFWPHALLDDDWENALTIRTVVAGADPYHPKRLHETGLFYTALWAIPVINSERVAKMSKAKMITMRGTAKKKPTQSDVIVVDVTAEYLAARAADDELESQAEKRGVRAHFVRGHFKTKPSGIYWWNAHIRGVGTPVEKTYVVTANE